MADIFDDFRKKLDQKFNLFDNFFSLNWEDEFDQFIDDTKKSTKNNKKDQKSNSYSISYRYGTGMKEPEIQVRGNVDEETLNRFLKGVQKQFGASIDSKSINLLKPYKTKDQQNEETASEKDYENETGLIIPFTDVIDTKENVKITLEMPGISADLIKVQKDQNKIDISAETSTKKYHKRLTLKSKITGDPKISANNGIITIEYNK